MPLLVAYSSPAPRGCQRDVEIDRRLAATVTSGAVHAPPGLACSSAGV